MSSNQTGVAKAQSRDGTEIVFERSGDGPPLLFVGDAFQQRSDPGMAQLAALLAPRFTVFNYGRRGRGDGDTKPHAAEREVEDLEALMAQAGGPASVFGISSGAIVALEAARRLPITKLALFEPPIMPAQRMTSVTAQTLVIAGEGSDPRLRRTARALWAVLPDVQHCTLEGQTHDWAPEALAPVLERFFAGSGH